jgi:transposase
LTRRPLPCRALVEAATHACTHRVYGDRYQQTKARIGKQRGAKVAQIDLARRLAEAIWHTLTRGEPFAPKGATGANSNRPRPPTKEAIER